MDVSRPESTVKFGTSNIRKLTNAKLGEQKLKKRTQIAGHASSLSAVILVFLGCDRQENTDANAKIFTTKYCGCQILHVVA